MTDTKKILWLHIGAPKTGTSAIQTGLALNRDKLLEFGVVYPEFKTDSDAVEGMPTSGNAGPLARYLRKHPEERPRVEMKAKRTLERAFVGPSAALFSSEMMAAADRQRLESVVGWAEVQGWETRAIYYVRHIADHAISQHTQRGRSGVAHSLRDRLGGYRATFGQVKTFESVIGKDRIALRIYDEDKSRLLFHFCSVIVGDQAAGLTEAPVVNRAVSPVEKEAIRRAAADLQPKDDNAKGALFQKITRELTLGPAKTRAELIVEPEELAQLERNNRGIIDYINENYFGGAERLRIKSDVVRVGHRAEPNIDREAEIEALRSQIVERFNAASAG